MSENTTYKWVSEQRLLYFTRKLKEHFPELTSLIDDATSVTTKTYSSSKIDELISAATSNQGSYSDIIDDTSSSSTKTYSSSKILDLISGITGISFEKIEGSYDNLPETGATGKIYLVPNNGVSPDVYDEYIFIFDEGSTTSGTYEKIGTTAIELEGYVKSSEMVEITTAEIDNIISTVWSETT